MQDAQFDSGSSNEHCYEHATTTRGAGPSEEAGRIAFATRLINSQSIHPKHKGLQDVKLQKYV